MAVEILLVVPTAPLEIHFYTDCSHSFVLPRVHLGFILPGCTLFLLSDQTVTKSWRFPYTNQQIRKCFSSCRSYTLVLCHQHSSLVLLWKSIHSLSFDPFLRLTNTICTFLKLTGGYLGLNCYCTICNIYR